MSCFFTEDTFEQAVIELFKGMDYTRSQQKKSGMFPNSRILQDYLNVG